jgi:hypothetical protein
MSLKVITAVHDSRIEPRLRHLAQTLAIFSTNDDGSEIWPGISRLTQALGVEERAVHKGLQELIDREVLERDGYHRRTRRFRFNLVALANYEPLPERTSAAKRDAARRREARKPRSRPTTAFLDEPDTCTVVQMSEAKTSPNTCTVVQMSTPAHLHRGAATPALQCDDTCTVVRRHLHRGAVRTNEDLELNEKSGADAPKSPDADASVGSDEGPEEEGGERPAFDVYAAVATSALEQACRDRDDSNAHVAALFTRCCAERKLPYDGKIARQAIDAAIVTREKAKREFLTSYAKALQTPFPHARGGEADDGDY